MKIHYGEMVSLGNVSMQSKKINQKLNTRISTESEIVRVDNHVSGVLWSMLFLETQEYRI